MRTYIYIYIRKTEHDTLMLNYYLRSVVKYITAWRVYYIKRASAQKVWRRHLIICPTVAAVVFAPHKNNSLVVTKLISFSKSPPKT